MKIIISLFLVALLFLESNVALAAKRYGEIFCDREGFHCITVKRGDSWQKLWPEEYQQEIVKRLNRMNTPLYRGMKIAVPNDLANTNLNDISPFPLYIDPPNERLVVVDPSVMAWGAYDSEGILVNWGPMSGGQKYCSDVKRGCRTITGSFRVYSKQGPNCKSKKFPVGKGGAPMPYCMFFHGGFALHASSDVPGYHASHGCVRLFREDAEWLNTDFVYLPSEDGKGTKVVVNPYL